MPNVEIPSIIESALADYTKAVRDSATHPCADTQKSKDEAHRVLRSMIASELSDAREDGGRIAMGYAPLD